MPERTEKLRATLAELHRELSDANALDPESRGLLHAAHQEILDSLAKASPEGGLTAHPPGFRERLSDAALRVEGEHPALAAVVGRLLDTLANMGI